MNVEKLQCPECRKYTLVVRDADDNRQCEACGFSVLASQIFTVGSGPAETIKKVS
jgi:ribosomal protein S27E